LGSALGLVALVVALLANRAGAGPIHRTEQRIYVVVSGDTVWSIARRAVGPSGDPRPVVDSVIRENRLQDAVVFPGQRLRMPGPDQEGSGRG
jgi:LysM domain